MSTTKQTQSGLEFGKIIQWTARQGGLIETETGERIHFNLAGSRLMMGSPKGPIFRIEKKGSSTFNIHNNVVFQRKVKGSDTESASAEFWCLKNHYDQYDSAARDRRKILPPVELLQKEEPPSEDPEAAELLRLAKSVNGQNSRQHHRDFNHGYRGLRKAA